MHISRIAPDLQELRGLMSVSLLGAGLSSNVIDILSTFSCTSIPIGRIRRVYDSWSVNNTQVKRFSITHASWHFSRFDDNHIHVLHQNGDRRTSWMVCVLLSPKPSALTVIKDVPMQRDSSDPCRVHFLWCLPR